MEQNQKEQMVEALYEAFRWARDHGNFHGVACVMLGDGGKITWEVRQNVGRGYGIIARVWSLDNMLSSEWADNVDFDDEESINAALRNGAVSWVEEFGDGALETAKQQPL